MLLSTSLLLTTKLAVPCLAGRVVGFSICSIVPVILDNTFKRPPRGGALSK